MYVRSLKLKNWRNFREAHVHLSRTSFFIGANASGKSNLLDVFRFLRDICKTDGGGLQKAINLRGGLSKLRCLHHRRDTEVLIEVQVVDNLDETDEEWTYRLGFRHEGTGGQRIFITQEYVEKNGEVLLDRPDTDDKADSLLRTETHMEQSLANRKFRELSDFFGDTTYLHLVPQLLKYNEQIGGNRLEDDPFGQGFLERLANTQKRVRDSRLTKISKALSVAVPQFKDLRYKLDKMGHPHLEALYEHHRPNAGWQQEEHFSDGTLRLLGILWSLLDGKGLLLIEEPELSLHEAVVEQIPLLIDRVQRGRSRRQILISTHSHALLGNPGIDQSGISILRSTSEGTTVRKVNKSETLALQAGLTVAEVVLPHTRPEGVEQLGMWE